MTAYISTNLRPNEKILIQTKQAAKQLNLPYIERGKRSIESLQQETMSDILIIGKERMELYPFGSLEPIFFHPSSAMFRIKRLERGEKDPLIEVSQLSEGDSFLDCTLGLGSDSIVAAYQAGETGTVVGIEKNQLLFFLVKEGFKNWLTEYIPLQQALRRIKPINTSYLTHLNQLPDNSFDCVYFDPMFDQTIEEAEVMRNWGKVAQFTELGQTAIEHAVRVARKRVVLKAHYRSPLFKELGFTQIVRKSAKFHFGFIEVK
ncbi:MAG TPA: class I SAM-dependent methyltransferase [Bacillus sp. (in: firmicutes)]|uniref:class I SAM-dependent methyltransferase n=1 Tax=Bacillus litorisediminis TaxID=2922713 RepID=UPI001FAC9F82|nr:class I SAM-dependent methyltransferase [Bacillus litorisediminis]HWO76317.1 class I SAM-dependent methyltransferase [Bacillus sp. (in: firmicutes)]